MSGTTQSPNKRILKVSYYITTEFSRQGIVIQSKINHTEGKLHLFDYELDYIYAEYRKWKDSQQT
jgi:hypothetical protein